MMSIDVRGLRAATKFAGASLLVIMAALGIQAQQTPALAEGTDAKASSDAKDIEEVVVTGTLIRGIAPGGSNTLAITAADALATGATNTAELLATMPQSGFFATLPVVLGSNNYKKSVNRPTLRNLDAGATATNPTLLLLDGHRLVGMGVLSNSPDLDAIPGGAIERIDVVPDGGSAIYGADAVGGVINLITHKNFNGVQADARYGFADNYSDYTTNLTAGKTWGALSAYVSYNYDHHDPLYGRDRGYVQRVDWVNSQATGTRVLADSNCTPANIVIGTSTYASATSPAGLGNRCDLSDDKTFFPLETRHSVLGNISLDPGGSVSFNVKAYYTNRLNVGNAGPIAGSTTLTSTNPYYVPVAAVAGTPSETIKFNFGSTINDFQRAQLDTWGVTPSVRVDFGHDWQLNALFNYGVGTTVVRNQAVNTTTLAAVGGGAVGSGGAANPLAGTFNPFNVGAAGNGTDLAALSDFFVYGKGTNKLTNGRAVADGPLFSLPGGTVKLAVGTEAIKEQTEAAFSPVAGATSAAINALVPNRASRSIYAGFGELSVPIMGQGYGPLHSLSLSLAGRYDHYSDFGGTFNPKIGVNLEPIDWIKLRGSWGKSFQAPGLSDSQAINLSTFSDFSVIFPASPVRFPNPAVPIDPTVPGGQIQLAIGGGGINLKPQKARTWTLGFDVEPPVVPGLNVSLTYYNIVFRDRIVQAAIQAGNYYTVYPSQFFIQGTPAAPLTNQQLKDFAALAGPVGVAGIAKYVDANYIPGKIYNIVIGAIGNLATVKTSGLDFTVGYEHPTHFGSVFGNLSGNYVLRRLDQATASSPAVDTTSAENPQMRYALTVGVNIGKFLAQGTFNHSGGFDTAPSAATLNQSKIGAFNYVDLFFKYDLNGTGLSQDVTFTLNVNNVFDKDPPLYRGTYTGNSDGYANGGTVGRLISFGVSKKF